MAGFRVTNMTNANNSGKYLVEFTTTIDHPELRDDSYRPVQAGTRCYQKAEFATRRAALALVDDILSGQYDFASELVTSVRCTMAVNVRIVGQKPWREVLPRTERARVSKVA
jgi:hypothetical protein